MANYLHIPAIGQKDPELCWAACLAWWLKAAKNIEIKQERLRDRHSAITSLDGTLSNRAIKALIKSSLYKMTFDQFEDATKFTVSALQEHLDYGPVYTAYTEASTQKKHVNVIWDLKGSGNSAQVTVMEPQADAMKNSNNQDTGFYIGKHVTKNLSEFNTIGSVYVGSLMWCV